MVRRAGESWRENGDEYDQHSLDASLSLGFTGMKHHDQMHTGEKRFLFFN